MEIALSKNQRAIVEAPPGPLLVKASPGSGKTRVLTERIRFLLTLAKRKILAITFTNKAAEEMRGRLKKEPNIDDRTFIGTFHSFCEYVLKSHGRAIGLSPMPHIFEDETDRLKLIESAIEQTPSLNQTYIDLDDKEKNNLRRKALATISQVKRGLLTPEELLKETEDDDLVLLYSTYQELLSSQNAIDFDDLLYHAYRLFMERPRIAELYRRSFEHICIDEAQDLNHAQYELLRALTGTEYKNVLLVGDPNQSIYAFNGSSPDFMIKEFPGDYGATTIELTENFRSSKEVIRVAEKVIPKTLDLKNAVFEGEFDFYRATDEKDEAKWILNKIEELVALGEHTDIEGPIAYEKIAVLARNKYVFKELDSLLSREQKPFYYKKAPGPMAFESDEMKAFYLGLHLRLNPQDSLHKQRLIELVGCNVPGNACGPDCLTQIISCSEGRKFSPVLKAVLELDNDAGNMVKTIDDLRERFKSGTEPQNEDERRMILDDIDELKLHWRNYARGNTVKSLQHFRNAAALGYTHPLSQHNGITLSTVHTMKGQEYDIVFVMGLDEGTFPDYRAIRSNGLELKQEKNNLYVALTRSKRLLYVTWPVSRVMPWGDKRRREVSRFLEFL